MWRSRSRQHIQENLNYARLCSPTCNYSPAFKQPIMRFISLSGKVSRHFFLKNTETNSFDLLELFDRGLKMARLICSFLFLSIFLPAQNVNAQSIEISVYGGVQSSPHSRITGKHSTSGAQYSDCLLYTSPSPRDRG